MQCAQAQHDAESAQAAAAARQALRAERGCAALAKRAIILHGGKLVALAAFAAAMQAPGAVGWLLTGALASFTTKCLHWEPFIVPFT